MQLTTVLLYSQAPSLINYQAVARDASGAIVAGQPIGLKFELKQGGSAVFTETQNVSTNALGLFSTQIGKINTGGLNSVDWKSGNLSLEVSVDVSGGTSFVSFGTQQLVSVPYAMHAASVPATYSNNVLTIGGQSFSLSTSTSASPQTTITSSGIGTITSAGTNTFDINVPATSLTGAGSATVSGAFPNYTISTPAALAVHPVTVTASGVATVMSAGTNTFDVNVPATNLSSGTNVAVSGTYPNYTISSLPSLALTGNNLSISGGNTVSIPAGVTTSLTGSGAAQVYTLVTDSYSIHVPQSNVALTTAGGTASVTNVGTNSVSINIPASGVAVTSVAGTASVTNIGTNSVSINIPPSTASNASFVTSGAVSTTTLSANSFSINVPTSSVAVTSVAGTASVTSLGTNSVSINIPPSTASNASFVTSGAVSTTTLGANSFSINVPTTSVAVTSVAGTASVTSLGTNSVSINIPPSTASNASFVTSGAVSTTTLGANSFSINVPQANVALTTAGGTASITNVGTNSVSINVPQSNVAVTTVAGTASVTNVGTNSVSINIPPSTASNASFVTSGAVSTTTLGANSFSINVPTGSVQVTSVAGTASVTSLGTNSVSINIPPASNASVVSSGAATTTTLGTNSYSINVPTSSVAVTSVAGTASVTSLGTNSVSINIPPSTASNASFVTSGAVTVSTLSANSFSIHVPATTVTASGIASVTPSGSAFDVNVPAPAFNAATGNLSFGTTSLNIVPTLTLNGTTLSTGPSTNSVSLAPFASPWTQSGGTVFIASNTVNVSIGSTTSGALLSLNNNSVTTRNGVNLFGARDEVGAGLPVNLEIVTLGQTFGTTTYGRIIRMANTTLGASFDMGIDQNSSFFLSRINQFSPTADFAINTLGYTGLGKSAPTERLDVSGNVRFSGALMPNNAAGTAGQILQSNGAGAVPTWVNNSGWSLTGNAGTTPGTNFIGTTDAKALMFKVNSVSSGLVDPLAFNTFLGYQSGLAISTGSYNTGVGNAALRGNTTGGSNTAFGSEALMGNSSGGFNAAFGRNALNAATGSNNNAFGSNVMIGVSGSGNSGFGSNALQNTTTGSNNSVFGNSAMVSNTVGVNNAAFGYNALNANNGSNNTAVGYQAGQLSTGSGNIFIGSSAGSTVTTGSNKLYIANSGTATLLYGDFTAGNIGINNIAPTQALDVTGNMRLSGAFMPNNSAGTTGQILQSNGTGAAPTWVNNSGSGWSLTGNAGTTAGTNFLGTTDAQDVVFKSNNTEVFRAQSAGVIRLLSGSDRTITMQGQTSNIDANNLMVRGSDAGIGGQARYGGALILQGGDGYNQSNPIHFGGSVVIRPGKNQYGAASYNSGAVIFQNVTSSNAYIEAARIDPNGNFGLGNSLPSEKLDVVGSVKIADGTQADGKVFVSDAAGKGSWKSSPPAIQFAGLNVTGVSVSTAATPLNTGTQVFTKQSASSEIQITLNSRIYGGSFSGGAAYIWFEIYVDGIKSPTASSVHYITANNTTEYAYLYSIFPASSLGAGSHTITIVAKTDTGTSSNVLVDSGGFSGRIILKEIY